jgi:hypothetical protein
MRTRLVSVAIASGLVATATPAFADVTLFIGANTTPSTRQVRGAALGLTLLIVGFEFEYAHVTDDPAELAPSLNTYSGNVLLQTPLAIAGVRPYFTVGAEFYREELAAVENTSYGVNVGGGVKISLAGPLRLRVDYRVFKLNGSAVTENPQRIYAGLNLSF